jgi:hypothetical protein
LNDDRPLAVNDVTVNEGSPYAVFTVTGATGQYVKLALAEGTAKVDADGTPLTDGTEDYGPALEYFNGTAWVPYTANSFVQIPAGGTTLLVRTAIINDIPSDNGQTFTLTATNTGTTAATGTATIKDDGTGTQFTAGNPTGSTPATITPPTPVNRVVSPADASKVPNEDRPLTVEAVKPVVNEASPYAAFVVSGAPDQLASLSLPSNTSSPLTDIEFWNGSEWIAYAPGSLIQLDSDGKALVRVLLAPEQEAAFDNNEPFALTAANTGGISATPATVTIKDDGTGDVFTTTDPTGITLTTVTPPIPVNGVVSAADAVNLPDDDRPLAVSDVTVNEGSPFAVFKVTGATGEYTSLRLTSGTATVGTDTGTALQFFNGTTWVNYNAGDFVQIPAGGLLVRAAINVDLLDENSETFNLVATSPGGHLPLALAQSKTMVRAQYLLRLIQPSHQIQLARKHWMMIVVYRSTT